MAAWQRANEERRRLACLRSQEQQREGIERLSRERGLHPITLPSLDDALAELLPPALL
jgi:hypothetical protein